MKIIKPFFFLCFLLISCDRDYLIDSRLNDYVQDFYKEGQKRGHHFSKDNLVIKLRSGMDEDFQNGLCIEQDRYFGDDQIVVYINDRLYNAGDTVCLRLTIFHELGHALLNRDHLDGEASIMNSSDALCTMINQPFYGAQICLECNWQYLLDELFK